jgi:rhamnosyltransferase
MAGESVCAVIITFHPSDQMLHAVAEVLAQVDGLVVVDNGSNVDELHPLRVSSQSLGFHLIENTENLGIAEALNQGVRWSKRKNYSWVILFDQDSRITDGFVTQMFAAWESHPDRERVVSIHPRYVDPDTGIEPVVRRARDGGPVLSMTSGALMPTWIFDRIGVFASEYFIDWVDFEYCFRIRAAGYLIADSRQAVLLHRAGHPQSLSFLGFSFRPTHHSAMRRYYLSRNRIAVYRKYFRVFPIWVLQSMYESLRETFKCFLGDQNRARKFRNFLLGTWDGLTGRMGKREGL